MEVKTHTHRGLHALAVVLASVTIAAPLTAGSVTEAILDAGNPAGLSDVTAGLAYLREILIAGLVTLGVVVVAFIVTTVVLAAKARRARAIALPLVVFGIQAVLLVILLVAGGIIDGAGG